MKRYIWLVAIVIGTGGLCFGQDVAKTTELQEGDNGTDIPREETPWQISAGLVFMNWPYEQSAMQHRSDASLHGANDWEQGDSGGKGWGLQTRVGRGDGHLDVKYLKADLTYLITPPGGRHRIDTIGRELEVSWTQTRGRDSNSDWGSIVGFRYLSTQSDVQITEGIGSVTGSVSLAGTAAITWLALMAGYEGNWQPFQTPTLQVHGSTVALLGEASGLSRSQSDTNWNDRVYGETYGKRYSLGYGARLSFGVDVSITRQLQLSVDYMREWLYSFNGTDTGTVIFPDNNDALFIENRHAVMATLTYLFY